MDSTTIRQAVLADRDGIARSNIAMALETEGLELDPPTVSAGVAAALSDAAKGRYYLAEVSGEVVAQLMVTLEWSDWRNAQCWWVQSVYVRPEQRRRGLYRRLFAHVLEEARAQGAAGVRLYADADNDRAHAAYRSLGMGSHYVVFEHMF